MAIVCVLFEVLSSENNGKMAIETYLHAFNAMGSFGAEGVLKDGNPR